MFCLSDRVVCVHGCHCAKNLHKRVQRKEIGAQGAGIPETRRYGRIYRSTADSTDGKHNQSQRRTNDQKVSTADQDTQHKQKGSQELCNQLHARRCRHVLFFRRFFLLRVPLRRFRPPV